jgi:hypothetical protein
MRPDHWHVATSRRGRWEVLPERHDRTTARRLVRQFLVADGRTTADPRYEQAIAAIDQGYDTYRVDSASYAAFACACPSPSKGRIGQWSHCSSGSLHAARNSIRLAALRSPWGRELWRSATPRIGMALFF